LEKIPYGVTISYGELAKRLGNPDAVRAVGLANGRNPISIIVPCHRVIGANGTLTGYWRRSGAERWLLELERGGGLFDRQGIENRTSVGADPSVMGAVGTRPSRLAGGHENKLRPSRNGCSSHVTESHLILAAGGFLAPLARADDWPQWRGPARNGISQEKGWLDSFPEQGPPMAWKANVGLGYSSFVVGNGPRLHRGSRQRLRYDLLFRRPHGQGDLEAELRRRARRQILQGGTTGSPTLDGDHLYWLSRWGDLFCFDAASGKIIWNRQLVKETQAHVPGWGFTGAPTVYKDLLILNVGEAGMAVDKKTGKEIWKSGGERTMRATARRSPSRATAKPEIWIGNSTAYLSLSPETGKRNWSIKWLTQYGVNAADPIPYGEKSLRCLRLRQGLRALHSSRLPRMPNPTRFGKIASCARNSMAPCSWTSISTGWTAIRRVRAQLKCVEIEPANKSWAQPDFGTGGLIVADGKIIAISARGELIVAPGLAGSLQADRPREGSRRHGLDRALYSPTGWSIFETPAAMSSPLTSAKSNMKRRSFLKSAGVFLAGAPYILGQNNPAKFRTALIGCGWWGKNI
jgi:O-6-methylguanine DNA methyltransferase